jgi:hypothetical protein
MWIPFANAEATRLLTRPLSIQSEELRFYQMTQDIQADLYRQGAHVV